MLRFPSTHGFFQFAGYPGFFQEMDDVLKYLRKVLPHVLHVGDPELRVWQEDDEDAGGEAAAVSNGSSRLRVGRISFWSGFSGGGIVALPSDIDLQQQRLVMLDCLPGSVPFRRVKGTWLGNRRPLDPAGYRAGEALMEFVAVVEPQHVPAIAVKFGLARRVPEPRVGVTLEHLEELSDRRWLLIVPQTSRKSPLKWHERIPEWFAHFGITAGPAEPVSDALRTAMSDWFEDPQRPMYLHPLEGGEADAAWQLVVVNYIADHWSIQTRGLNSVHLLAQVERAPGFRRYWTSNR